MKMKISLIFLLFISTYIFSGVYASQCKSYWECCECTSDYYKDCYECVNGVCDWNKIVSVHNRDSKCQGMVSSTTTTTVTISTNRQTTTTTSQGTQCSSYWECCNCTGSQSYKRCYECDNGRCTNEIVVDKLWDSNKCPGSTTTTTIYKRLENHPGTTNCINGIDDDEDGSTDCNDPDCDDFTWNGYPVCCDSASDCGPGWVCVNEGYRGRKCCYDSDGGDNRITRGYMIYEGFLNWEECATEPPQEVGKVSESICESGGFLALECPSGTKCQNGACVEAPSEICNNLEDDDVDGSVDCADSDCIGTEGCCLTDADCPAGWDARYEWCISSEYGKKCCHDSDGGINIYEKGLAGAWWDYCSSNNEVIEYYCEPGNSPYHTGQKYTCPSGYTCQDGACKKTVTTTTATIKQTTTTTISETECKSYWECCNCTGSQSYKKCYECINGKCTNEIAVDKLWDSNKCSGSTTTTLSITCHDLCLSKGYTSISCIGCGGGFPFCHEFGSCNYGCVLQSESTSDCGTKCSCFHSVTCGNEEECESRCTDSGCAPDFPTTTTTQPQNNENCYDKIDNDIDGLVDCADPDCFDYKLPDGYPICCLNDNNCDSDAYCQSSDYGKQCCYDTDGGINIYEQGNTARGANNLDYCSSNNEVIEYYCEPGDSPYHTGQKYNCPNGYICQNGACKIVTNTTTTTSTTVKSTTTTNIGTGCSSYWDCCKCTGTQFYKRCYKCDNGRCTDKIAVDKLWDSNKCPGSTTTTVKPTTTTTIKSGVNCTDTDGGWISTVKGTCKLDSEPIYTDKCLDSNLLLEAGCEDTTGDGNLDFCTRGFYECSRDGKICQNGTCVENSNKTIENHTEMIRTASDYENYQSDYLGINYLEEESKSYSFTSIIYSILEILRTII